MTRFVTGGAGFIGANFLFYLRERYPDDRLVCIDKLTYAGNLSTLAPLLGQPNFRFARVDICDREAVYALFAEERPDVVINFAAESHVDRSIADPSLFLQTNIIGTSVLMDACREYGNIRFHQVSTDEVYGDLPLDRPELLFTEQTPLHTSSPYSSSKAAADLLVGAYGRTYGLPVTISRCSNNYGPYQFPEKLIPLMIVSALADRPLPVYGRGLNVRDWLYVADHCRAIDLVVTRGRIGDVSNIGGHNEMRNIDIVRLICHRSHEDPHRARLAAGDKVRRRHRPHDRLVSCAPRLVGGDRLRRIPELLRADVRRAPDAVSGKMKKRLAKKHYFFASLKNPQSTDCGFLLCVILRPAVFPDRRALRLRCR